MATIGFYGNAQTGDYTDLTASSGLGFFGATFGTSVQVGQYQASTFITNGTGQSQGPQVENAKYISLNGVSINGGATVAPSSLALASGTINVRFTHTTAINTQNGKLQIFDRTTPSVGATGVTTQMAQLVNGGSGVSTSGTLETSLSGWWTPAPSGSSSYITLLNNPGSGGLGASGASDIDTRHDWYFIMSASPDSIGSKEAYGLYIELEYL